MPSMSLIIGSLCSEDRDPAMTIGNGVHFLILGTMLSGIGYAAALSVLEDPRWYAGVALGLIHGPAVGVGLGLLDEHHVKVRSVIERRAPRRRRPLRDEKRVGSIRPGMFGVNWGDLTPLVLMSAHAANGYVFFLVYDLVTGGG